ncbi:MAG: AzlD domain-containing protein [Clostridia bacterium]|nr:AzlD domain-containing protein [Clostridia bacterium]MBR2296307.1 AzlD domain-containing protein [Clostridia bacterium]
MVEPVKFLLYLLVMAGVTYLVRMLPMVLVRKKIKNTFIRSFLYYVPYAVLSVMTIPGIFSSTSYLASAICGFAVALVLSYFNRSLLTVAASACGTVLVVELIITYLL